jgi:dTDP-4-amino-4,6-dideoxygalactose transaminase
MIPVTKTFLPPIEEYITQVQRAYDNGWLTNRGELVKELEEKLASFLCLKEAKILCMNNGTIPLQIAIKILGQGGEIITTPFSYVATTSSIVWEGCTPVFVDIHPDYLTIDETKIEASITDKTTCILATHVFGNPCNVEAIKKIADKHNLKVIYDAAHCFGVKYKGKSIFEYGDVSTCSFHATKVFHTGEGGAIFCKDEELFHKFFYSHNFGHIGPHDFEGVGINGKMSELHAAMGLCVLEHIDEIFLSRQNIVEFYANELLSSSVSLLKNMDFTDWNFSYYPVIFPNEKALNLAITEFEKLNIFPRRYFYPSLNSLNYLQKVKNTNSEDISSRIFCLPLYYGLSLDELKLIVNVLKKIKIKKNGN